MDTYINQFDSIYHADLQDKGEVEVTQILLSGDTIVLPLNQIADSLAVISLCTSPAFLSILHHGKITTSLYGKISSVKEYLIGNLRGVIEGNSAFIFSSLPFLYEIDGRKTQKAAQLELLKELKRCIESDDWIPDFTAYSKDYSPFAEQIVNWCLGLHNLIRAIDPAHYRKNLVRAQKKDLTMWVEETFAAMDSRGDENVPAYRDILRDINRPNRTDYQNAIDAARGSYGDPFCDRLQAAVNYCYNRNLSYLICDRARLVVPQQYSFLTEQQQPIAMGFEGSLLFDRVYRPVEGVFRRAVLDWNALNEILIEMDAALSQGDTLESVQMQLNNQYCIDYTEFAGRLCCTADAMDTLAAGKLCGEQTADISGGDSFRIRQE